jgi:acyl carrier protein
MASPRLFIGPSINEPNAFGSSRGRERDDTQNMLAIEQLQGLPLSERREGLEELVTAEFRTTLMMADDEELPFDMSYFDLGFTSLRITEIKEWLETQLGRRISTNVLFNSPTMEDLISYLADDVLADLFAAASV